MEGWRDMAKFIFSMENILQIKWKLEDQAKAEYSRQMGILRQEENKLDRLRMRKEAMQEQLRGQIVAVLDLMRIRQLQDGVENIKYNISVQKVVIFNQQKQVDKAREKLDKAMIERKTYEKLKENAFEEFKKEVNAEEQKEINELVSFRFGQSVEREG
jgi:flagellar FliJ protein